MTTNANAPVETRHDADAYAKIQEGVSLSWLAQHLANLEAARAESAAMSAQIDKLANFIMANVPGEPSQSEGAVDCAIRVIEAANNRLAEIERIAGDGGRSAITCLTAIKALASGHTPSPCPSCAAKDEAMEAFKAEVSDACAKVDKYLALDKASKWKPEGDARATLSRFINPPADTVAEALKEAIDAYHEAASSGADPFPAALAELKKRLPRGGAK